MPESGNTKSVSIIALRGPVYYQFGIQQEIFVLRRVTKSIRHVLSVGISKGYVRYQIGITFPGLTGTRGGTIHKRGAQGNAVVRSHRNTRIGDASGVLTRAAEGRQIAEFVRTNDGGIFAGENGGREPPRRLSVKSNAGSCSCGKTGGVFIVTGASGASVGRRDATSHAAVRRRRDPLSVRVTLLSGRGYRGCGPCRRGCR